MGTVGVVMGDVDPKDPLEVASADDQQPVQTLSADGLYPTFGVRVGLGRLHRRQQHLGALRAEYIIEAPGELRVMVADEDAQLSPAFASTSSRLRACWMTQGPLGLAVTPARWTRLVSSSIKNST